MPLVKNRKLVFVRKDLNDVDTFTHDFRIGFTPHDMIVRSVSAGQETHGADIYMVSMEGVGDLFHYVSEEQSTPKHIFHVNKNIDGQQKFRTSDIDGAPRNTIVKLLFTLEFIEYYE